MNNTNIRINIVDSALQVEQSVVDSVPRSMMDHPSLEVVPQPRVLPMINHMDFQWHRWYSSDQHQPTMMIIRLPFLLLLRLIPR